MLRKLTAVILLAVIVFFCKPAAALSVLMVDNEIPLQGEQVKIQVLLSEPTYLRLTVKGEGQKCRTINFGLKDAGTHSLTWDGKDLLGKYCLPGKYTITIHAETRSLTGFAPGGFVMKEDTNGYVPYGIAIGPEEGLFLTDAQTNSVLHYLHGATSPVTTWGKAGFNPGEFTMPFGIAWDKGNRVYVVDGHNHRVQVFGLGSDADPQRVALFMFGEEGSGDLHFKSPRGIAVNSKGQVTVADAGNNRVKIYSVFLTPLKWAKVDKVWGQRGQGEGQFNFPMGVAVDSQDNIYVADYRNNRIQKFCPQGAFLLAWGTAGEGAGQFQRPIGIAIDGQDRIYVVDEHTHRVQVFDALGNFQLQWQPEMASGTPAQPMGVAVDGEGIVYVISVDSVGSVSRSIPQYRGMSEGVVVTITEPGQDNSGDGNDSGQDNPGDGDNGKPDNSGDGNGGASEPDSSQDNHQGGTGKPGDQSPNDSRDRDNNQPLAGGFRWYLWGLSSLVVVALAGGALQLTRRAKNL